jgi:hypothetical protein
MSSVATRFENFLSNISLTAANREDAKVKYDGVAGKLHSHYYPTTTYNGSTKLLIGSYGKGTAVRPPRDVDVRFLMPAATFKRYDDYIGNGQSQLLQDIKRILQQRYPSTDISGDGQVVVVPFTNGHTVELLPAWQAPSGKYIIPDTHAGGSWKLADHTAELAYVADSDRRSLGKTRALIKMMKTWQATCNVPIRSLVIELRSVNFLKAWQYYDKSSVYYDWMVRDYFSELLKHVHGSCPMPGTDEKILYGNAWKSRAETAHARAVKACQYEAADQTYSATEEWRKIFGSAFEY